MPKGKQRASPSSSEAASVPSSPSNPPDFHWVGNGSAEEGTKRTFYQGFERNGEKFQLKEFVHVKSPGKQRIIVQIVELWEEYAKRNRQTLKTFIMGNVFQMAAKNGSIMTEEKEISPEGTKYTAEIKDIEEKCTVQSKEEAQNVKNFIQQENHYCISVESNGEKRDEPLLPDSPPKRARSESPNKSSNAKRRKLTQSFKNGRVSLSPRMNGTLTVDEESSSDEERSYKRSLKLRLAFEQQERQANREQREKWEQQSVNNRFFKVPPRKSEVKNEWESVHAVQKLVEANLFSLSSRGNRVPSDLLDPKAEEKHVELVTPRWRTVDDYDTLWDPKVDMLFNKDYKQGLLKTPDDEPKKKEAIKGESKLAHVRKFFDPNVWGEEEIALFKQLLCAYGQDWIKISSLMLSKDQFQLEEYYVNNRYDLTCELCGSTENDEQLLLCDGCDRAYHTYCLNPPLKLVPKTSWFCTKNCEMLHKKKCEICKSGEDEQSMLLCDQCDKGFHLYCLDPPLLEIPKEDWSCEPCKLEDSNNKKALTVALQNIVSQGEVPNPVDSDAAKLQVVKKSSKKVVKRAESMAESLSSSLTYNALKHWAVSCLEEPPTHLRESTIAVVDHASIFAPQISPIDFTEEKLSEHFESILLAGELAVDRLIKNPTIEDKVTEIVLPNYQPVSRELDDRRYKDSNDGFGNGPRSWIFQANSGIYDIEGSLKSLKKMTWFVKQHIHRIKKGDRVYIWVSGKDAGVLAVGTVLCDPSQMSEDKSMKKFFVAVKNFNATQLRVNISIDYILPKRVEKSVFVNHPMLSHLTILRQPIGTNFKLTRSEATAIEKILSSMFGKELSTTSSWVPTQPSTDYVSPSKKRKVTPSSTSPTNQPLPNTPAPKDCSICASPENQDRLLTCDSCETKYHLGCITPRLKRVPHGSWSCKKCTALNSKACCVCSSTEDDDRMLLCDGCDEGFHLHCLDPPLVKVPKDEHWFCKSCKLSDSEVLACKLLLGNKELHLEARRLFRNSCEELCKIHQKNLSLNGSNAKKVLKQLQDITVQLGEIKHQVIGIANNCLLSWKETLLTPAKE